MSRPDSRPPGDLDRRGMTVLSLGHAFTDQCQGTVPALLPFLIAQRGYSYAAVSALVLAATVSSSVVQPLFGHFSDRRSLPWLLPAGVALAGAGVAAVGYATTYGLTFAAIVASGIGVAAFHPEASRFANYVSGARRATGMSLFSVGGNAGFALGPIVVTPLLLGLGLHGTPFVFVGPAVMALVLASELGRLRGFRPDSRARAPGARPGTDAWGPFTRLSLVVAVRSIVYFGLLTFVPLYFVGHLHTGKVEGNAALAVMLVAGAVGTLVGGRLADRYGRRIVLRGSMASLPALIAGLLFSGPGVGMVLLALIGALTIATFSVTVVMGQEYLPTRIGVASGVTLGLAIGIGGVGAALLGAIADHAGVRTVIEIVAALPIPALALALTLPERHVSARAAARLADPTAAGAQPVAP